MGKRNKTNLEQPTKIKTNNSQPESNVFSVVLFYCLLIIFAPIITFFASKYLILDSIYEPIPSNIWSAILAVIVLHLALGLFLYRAYFSDEIKPQTNRKQD